MTPKQRERIQQKIKKLKSALAADKKKWGGFFNDGQGVRYLIPPLYLQLQDYPGARRYFTWFTKNFPDDRGFPDFLFEWAVTLFYNNNIKEAEKKAFETFCSNTYLFDKFFGREIAPVQKWEGSDLEAPDFTDYFDYSAQQPHLADFSNWLRKFEQSEKFRKAAEKFISLRIQLHTEDNPSKREKLGDQEDLLEKEF